MITLTEIPKNLQTDFLTESVSNVLPELERQRGFLFIPVFVRSSATPDGEIYRYFRIKVPFTGQNTADYEQCKLQSYAHLRRFFYGDFAAQNEQILKGTFASHQYAVRLAFPKSENDVISAVERFNAIKDVFWATVTEACVAVGKTRSDLPEKFDAETMLAFAATNGMTESQIAGYAQKFSVISLNLLHNNRNWEELF